MPTTLSDLTEYVNSRGISPTVDKERGVIRGVKILGTMSRNGRTYPAETLRNAVGLYEGKAVNVDHAEKIGDRSYRDRIATLTSVQARDDGLYGDLIYNPRHALAEQLAWDAEHAPHNVGLSHDVRGKVSQKNGNMVVESIEHVRSVDLVAEPATTMGLFESVSETTPDKGETRMEIDLKEVTLADVEKHRPELLKEYAAGLAEVVDVKAKDAKIKDLGEKLKEAEGTITKAKQDQTLAKELQEAKLDQTDEKHCPPFFLAQLRETEKAEDRKAIVEDRKALVEAAAGGKRRQSANTKPKSGFSAAAGGGGDGVDWEHFLEDCQEDPLMPVLQE